MFKVHHKHVDDDYLHTRTKIITLSLSLQKNTFSLSLVLILPFLQSPWLCSFLLLLTCQVVYADCKSLKLNYVEWTTEVHMYTQL